MAVRFPRLAAAALLLSGTLTALPLPARAADNAALVLLQGDYRYTRDFDAPGELDPITDALEQTGFTVTALEDGDDGDMLDGLELFLDDLPEKEETALVILSGHFVTTGVET